MKFPSVRITLVSLVSLVVVGGGALVALAWVWPSWSAPRWNHSPPSVTTVDAAFSSHEEARILELSPQARKNLGLVSKPARLQEYWRTVVIPGEVIDRPGVSDLGITSPAVGVVTHVHAFPGDTVRKGQELLTLRLFSEYLQNSQSELFRATRETELLQEQIARLDELARSGAIPEARIIDLNQQLRRQNGLIQAHRQDLLTRGLQPEQIEQVASGNFVSSIAVLVPSVLPPRDSLSNERPDEQRLDSSEAGEFVYELQELAVELGQQVQAGQLLAKLSDHRALYVVGHAFLKEASLLERVAQEKRPVTIGFPDDDDELWPAWERTFEIRHLANAVDRESRTFDFFIGLENQARSYERNGETFLLWRFRPGQRARLQVPVEKFTDVFVLPASAVVREGPEAYVFRQNGDLFDRRAVHVLHEDSRFVVIAHDRSITPGMYLAQSSAASLNRVLKSQAARGEQPGLHVHADGTVHAAH